MQHTSARIERAVEKESSQNSIMQKKFSSSSSNEAASSSYLTKVPQKGVLGVCQAVVKKKIPVLMFPRLKVMKISMLIELTILESLV